MVGCPPMVDSRCIYTCIYINMCINTCKYIYMYIYTCIYIYLDGTIGGQIANVWGTCVPQTLKNQVPEYLCIGKYLFITKIISIPIQMLLWCVMRLPKIKNCHRHYLERFYEQICFFLYKIYPTFRGHNKKQNIIIVAIYNALIIVNKCYKHANKCFQNNFYSIVLNLKKYVYSFMIYKCEKYMSEEVWNSKVCHLLATFDTISEYFNMSSLTGSVGRMYPVSLITVRFEL